MATSKIKKPDTFFINVDGSARRLYVKHGNLSISNDNPTSVTFSSPFPNACISVMLTCSQLNFGSPSTISVGETTRTGFKLANRNGVSANMGIAWIAFGY